MTRPSSDVLEELNQCREHLKYLDARIEEMEDNLQLCKQQKDKLDGGPFSRGQRGKIADLRRELADAQLAEKDATAMWVVWEDSDQYRDSVIDKVTAKLIWVRIAGHSSTDKFYRNCESFSGLRRRIDIRKTFGIDADEVPPNYKPEKP